MTDAVLSLVVPAPAAQALEDLLLDHPELVHGFTTADANGHGASVHLAEAAELVSGHAPRQLVQMVGTVAEMQAIVALVRRELAHANIFYWLAPVLESGRIQ